MHDIVDMSAFIEAKSDQLNADDLLGTSRTVTVTRVVGTGGDQPVAVHYDGDGGKPFKPCKTMRRVMMAVWGRHGPDYVGRSMTLYRDDRVTFGGLETGGVRISHMSHIEKEVLVVVMKTKGKKAGIKILPLVAGQRDQNQQQKRQSPADWTGEYIAKVRDAPDLDALADVQRRAANALARLQADHPDLHVRAVDAGTRRAAELQPTEGRPDSEMGEGFNGAGDDNDPFGSAD